MTASPNHSHRQESSRRTHPDRSCSCIAETKRKPDQRDSPIGDSSKTEPDTIYPRLSPDDQVLNICSFNRLQSQLGIDHDSAYALQLRGSLAKKVNQLS